MMKVTPMTRYAELAVTTNFSFLRGPRIPGRWWRAPTSSDLPPRHADRNSFAGVGARL